MNLDDSLKESKTIKEIQEEYKRSYDVRVFQQCSMCEKFYNISKTTIYQASIYCFKCASKNQQIIEDWAKRLLLPQQMLRDAVNIMKWYNEEVTSPNEMRTLLEKKATKHQCDLCRNTPQFNGFPTMNVQCRYVCRRCVFRSKIYLTSSRDLDIEVDNYRLTIDRDVMKNFTANLLMSLPGGSMNKSDHLPGELEYSVPQPDVEIVLEDDQYCARCNICMNHFSDALRPMKCVCNIENHIMCEVCLIDYMAGSQMDTKGFLQCPYCRIKKEFKIKTPFVEKFVMQFQVDQDTLHLAKKCKIPQHKAQKAQKSSRTVLPGCWSMLVCKSQKHPAEHDDEIFLYIGMGVQDFGCLDYECRYCQKRMYAKTVYFSNCKGTFKSKLQREKMKTDELSIPKNEIKTYDLKNMQLAKMDIIKL